MSTTSLSGLEITFGILWVLSVPLVIWAVADLARRPRSLVSPLAKTIWIVAMVIGAVFGLLGGILASVYLLGVRRQFPTQAAAGVPGHWPPTAPGTDLGATPSTAPPPPPPPPEVPAGWFPDPSGTTRLRWWDGVGWSEFTKD